MIQVLKPRILNLYAGVGGNMELWPNKEGITCVEKNEKIASVIKERHPSVNVIIGDASEYLLKNYQDYDFIWSSRPCQSHTRLMKFTRHKLARFPDFKLYEEIIFLQHFFKGKWVVENVVPYYEPLIKPTAKIGRHLFWSNFPIEPFDPPVQPKNFTKLSTVEGKKVMMDWLGIHYEKNIYYEGNHCPVQVLRNAVHPKIGLHVFNCAMNQQTIFQNVA